MQNHFICPLNSVLQREVDRVSSEEKCQRASPVKHVLWVDIACEERMAKIWQKRMDLLHSEKIDVIGVLVPRKPVDIISWPENYQLLCDLVNFSKRIAAPLYYLVYSFEDARASKQVYAFVKYIAQKDLRSKSGELIHFQAVFYDNSLEGMKNRLFKDTALEKLDRVRQWFSSDQGDAVRELLPLGANFLGEPFYTALSGTSRDVAALLPSGVDIQSEMDFAAQFGNFKSAWDDNPLAAIFDISSQQREPGRQESFFSSPVSPFEAVSAQMENTLQEMPRFFSFPADQTFVPEFPCPKKELPGDLFCMILPGLEIDPVSLPENTLLHQIVQLFQSTGLHMGQLRPIRRGQASNQPGGPPQLNRRQVKRQLTADLEQLHQHITALIDNEHNHLTRDPDILFRDPDRFRMAYEQFVSFFFRGYLSSIINASWGTRRICFFLPLWFPSFAFRRTGMFPLLCGLMVQGIRMLNLYQYIYLSLINGREQFKNMKSTVTAIQNRSRALETQHLHIIQELNLIPHHQELIKEQEKNEPLFFVENCLPDQNELIEENKKKISRFVDEWESNLFSLLHSSFDKSLPFESEDDLKFWVPGYYNSHEAWYVARNMIQTMSQSAGFQFDKAPLSLPQGICVFCKCESIKQIQEEKEWILWKKIAIKHADNPFRNDVVSLSSIPRHIENNPSALMDWAVGEGFVLKDAGDRIGLCKQAFSCILREKRSFFFQHHESLSRQEFSMRLHTYAYHQITACLKWITTREFFQRNEFSDLRTQVDQFLPAGFSFQSSVKDLFKVIDQICVCNQNLAHPFLGKFVNKPSSFFLEDTLDPVLMDFFKPENSKTCKPRFFAPQYLINALQEERGMYRALIHAFNSLKVLKDESGLTEQAL
ncbi:MAG: hypothetical protein K9K40_13640 [Desulfotignum sp.]|nr:hypothetical protein [Desulfotignum sp.]